VRDPNYAANLSAAQQNRNYFQLVGAPYGILRSDLAVWDAPRATLGTDVRSFEIARDTGATHLSVTVVFPSEATVGADIGLTEYTVHVVDAYGRVVVETTERAGIGSSSAVVQIPAGITGPHYTVTVTGDRAVSDPDTLDSDALLNDTVTLQVVQLKRR
jgi:hypothetical protein